MCSCCMESYKWYKCGYKFGNNTKIQKITPVQLLSRHLHKEVPVTLSNMAADLNKSVNFIIHMCMCSCCMESYKWYKCGYKFGNNTKIQKITPVQLLSRHLHKEVPVTCGH